MFNVSTDAFCSSVLLRSSFGVFFFWFIRERLRRSGVGCIHDCEWNQCDGGVLSERGEWCAQSLRVVPHCQFFFYRSEWGNL